MTRFLERNLLVAAEKEKVEMARGRFLQAGAWINPTLSFSQEGYPVGNSDAGLDQQEFMVGARQEFELGGKRGKRRDLAQLELDVERTRFLDFVRRKKLELSRLFVGVFFAAEKVKALESVYSQYLQIRDAHHKRYEMGDVSGLAQLKIDAEEIWYLVQQAGAERRLNADWSELAPLIGWEGDALPDLLLREVKLTALPNLAVLLEQALQHRPDLAAEKLEAVAAERAVEVERARNVPNLSLGGGYKRDFGQHSFFLGIEIPLPLLDRREGAINEAIAANRRLNTLMKWKEIGIRCEVDRDYRLYSKLLAAAGRFGPDFIQKLDRTVEVTALSYLEGEVGVVEYLDAVRVQRDTVLELNRLSEELELARHELEASLGFPLHGITP